jgi:hypothetical protein
MSFNSQQYFETHQTRTCFGARWSIISDSINYSGMHGMYNANLHIVSVSWLCLCVFCRSCYQMPSDVGIMMVRPGSLPKTPESIGLNNSTDRNNFDNRKPRSRGSSPAERGYKKTSVARNGGGARRSRGNSPGDKSTGSITLPQSTDSE